MDVGYERQPRTMFLEGPVRCSGLIFVRRICIQDQSFNNFYNDTMKLSVNEAKLTGLCSRNCYSTGFEFKQFALGPEKFLELSRNEPQARGCR